MTCPPRSPLEEKILARVKPSPFQRVVLERLYEGLKRELEECLARKGLKGVVKPVGSYAKDTYTSDKWEVDVFVLLEGVDDSWIMEHSLTLLAGCLAPRYPLTVKYAQHPYVTVTLMGLEADVVPALKLDTPRRKGLGVERTPFHTDYVSRRLNDCMRDEVRLLKAFLKGIGVYGAETKVMGFGGYQAELLIAYYGSFAEAVKGFASWKPPVYIDVEGNGDKAVLSEKYGSSPLIIVDPVDPERNAAAAVSMRSLATLILASKLYLKNPSTQFFQPYSTPKRVKPRGSIAIIECTGDYAGKPPETIWGRARRGGRDLYDALLRLGFTPLYYSVDTDEYKRINIHVALLEEEAPPIEVARGPHAWDPAESITAFLEKRLNAGDPIWVGEDGRLYAVKERNTWNAAVVVGEWAEARGPVLLHAEKCSWRLEKCNESIEECTTSPGWLYP